MGKAYASHRVGQFLIIQAEAYIVQQRFTHLCVETPQTKQGCTFYSDDTYLEVDYFLVRKKIGSIKMRLWPKYYFERFFQVSYEHD